MSTHESPSLTRLARSDPVGVVDDELGRSPAAQAALTQILASDPPGSRRVARRRAPVLVLAASLALLLVVGGALAATDPFGLFSSPNPGTAIFAVDPARHVQPPTEQVISCSPSSDPVFRCSAGQADQRYVLLDHVQQNGPARLDRSTVSGAVQAALRSGTISNATARRIDADLAAVSDSFLAQLANLLRYGTLTTSLGSDSGGRVPPQGVPDLIVCEPAGAGLACRDLNGDDHAAVGSGIYQASPNPDWVPAPPHQPDPGWALEVAILGHAPSAAELRLITDLAMAVSTTSGSAGGPAQASPPGQSSP